MLLVLDGQQGSELLAEAQRILDVFHFKLQGDGPVRYLNTSPSANHSTVNRAKVILS